jgi:nitrilase
MTTLRVAAVQASYVLMDRGATIDRVAALTAAAAAQRAELVVFPEVFVPGTPFWIDTQPIWDGDEDWFALLAENAVVAPGPASDRLAAIAAEHQVWLVTGVNEREQHGATIYNTVLYFSPGGELAGRHRKLMPTGAERPVWGMGDGSTLKVIDTGMARIGGLTCWENYMPLARFHLYAQGVQVWIAPTLAPGDGWIATMCRDRAALHRGGPLITVVIIAAIVYLAFHLGARHTHHRYRKAHGLSPNFYCSSVRGPHASVHLPGGFRIGHRL